MANEVVTPSSRYEERGDDPIEKVTAISLSGTEGRAPRDGTRVSGRGADSLADAAPFQLRLPGFEGPLDLLVALVERSRLDVTAIPLAQVAEQYLAFLHRPPGPEPGPLADFIAAGARLLLLKSRSLLPGAALVADDGEREDEEGLSEALVAARGARASASLLGGLLSEGGHAYPRLAPPPLPLAPPPLAPVPAERLATLLQQALRRVVEPPVAPLSVTVVTIAEKVEAIQSALRRQGRVSFLDLAGACRSRVEVIVAFLALLHLVKQGTIIAAQAQPFGDMILESCTAGAAAEDV